MAKEAVSPIERHLEKGVLLLAVLLFAGAVVRYLVSSPNTTPIGTEQVGPKEVYDRVADKGRALRAVINAYDENVEPVDKPNFDPREYATAALPRPVPFSPPVPVLQAEEIGNVELVSLLQPTKPIASFGRSGAVLAPEMSITALPENVDDYYGSWNKIEMRDEGYLEAVNWVTVATTYDVNAQIQLAIKGNHPPGRAVPYLVGADVQRRERRWDGTYTEWGDTSIPVYAPLVLKGVHDPTKLPYLQVEEHDGKMQISDEMREEIALFEKTVKNPDYRLELMRPMPPRIAYGEYWRYEDVKALLGVDVLRLDDEVLFGEVKGNCPLWDRYPEPPKGPVVDISKNKAARERVVNTELDALQEWLAQGCYEAVVGQSTSLLEHSAQYFNAKQREKLQSLLEEASTLLAKEERAAAERERRGEPEPLRELTPIQVLWVHDTLSESVISGKTYQYRMRALMYNNYAGAATELKNPEDAEIVLRESGWSEPSDDISIPYDTDFYLVGKKERDQTAKVDVFKWHKGIWLKSAFRVAVGELIGGKDYVTIDKERVPIDFSTGTTIVDLDFDRLHRARRERRGVIDWSDPKPTLAMVYVDATGELHERLLDVDKRSASYKDMKNKVAEASRAGSGRP